MPWWCKSPVERFWSKVRKTDGCWLWTCSKDVDGYGRFKVGGRYFRAHRYSYELHYGDIEGSYVLMHSCDTPACVHPGHLSLGTPLSNNRDSIEKGRRKFGEFHPMAKLTREVVGLIRDEYATGCVRQIDLAKKHGVSRSLIDAITRNKIWKDAEYDPPSVNRWRWKNRRRVFLER